MNFVEKRSQQMTDAPKLWNAVCDAIKTVCQSYKREFPNSLAKVDWQNGIDNQIKISCSVGQGHNPKHPSAHAEEIILDYKPDASTVEIRYSTGSDIYKERPPRSKSEADSNGSYPTLGVEGAEPDSIIEKLLEPILFPASKV